MIRSWPHIFVCKKKMLMAVKLNYESPSTRVFAVSTGTKVLLRSDAGSCKSTAILFDKDCYVYGNAMSAII